MRAVGFGLFGTTSYMQSPLIAGRISEQAQKGSKITTWQAKFPPNTDD